MPLRIDPSVSSLGFIRTGAALEDLRREPSLSNCDLATFLEVCGPVASSIFAEIRETDVYRKMEGYSRSRCDMTMRVTVRAMYVARGEIPHPARSWHVDRSGGFYEDPLSLMDFRKKLRFPSFIATSIFLRDENNGAGQQDGAPRTEFLNQCLTIPLNSLICTCAAFNGAVDRGLSRVEPKAIRKARDREMMAFNCHTLHRPGVAEQSGWRLFFRAGLTARENYSLYINHIYEYHCLANRSGAEIFRRVGTKESAPIGRKRSYSWQTERSECLRVIHQNNLRCGYQKSFPDQASAQDAT